MDNSFLIVLIILFGVFPLLSVVLGYASPEVALISVIGSLVILIIARNSEKDKP